ncbi:MAG: oligosaccharide flippase family protein, partial [Candidatus Altiarchaeota archaeon]|nr:oligosaccharide flippase family protein [Candidatus Altiarchaeota archaeon]
MKLPKTAKQASIYGASKLLSRAISFLIFVYIARAIGPTNYGVYVYLMSVVTILLPLSRLGMDLELLRKSKQFGEKVAENAFSLYLVASMFAALLCFAIILSRGYSWILAGLTAG